MKKALSSTFFWPGHGFYCRLGPKLEDWEPVSGPEDHGVDNYEIGKVKNRMGR